MANLIRTALALAAVALFGLALWAMSTGDFTLAGMAFLSASIVIYFRETRAGDGAAKP